MARLDQITSLTRTDLIMLGALVLSISASVLASGVRNSFESMAYASPAQSVDTLSTHQVAITDQVDSTDQVDTTDKIDNTDQVTITEVSNIASEILPSSEVESRFYPSTLPDFSAINDVRTKKQTFFSYMLPKIRQANDQILANRRLLMMIRDDLATGDALDEDDIQFVSSLKARYKINQQTSLRSTIDDLLIRVDVVPESLVLAQAANESGWGTSRFARQANNLFGVWCFSKGCGLTPKNRNEGLNHEVAKYESVQEGVIAYVHTINTNPAYIHLRDIRATTRSEEQHFSGHALAEGLLKYSSRGIDYVREIQQLIRVNDLQKYTLPLQA
jgi:Bax protein